VREPELPPQMFGLRSFARSRRAQEDEIHVIGVDGRQ
jgi:hypothetical protein